MNKTLKTLATLGSGMVLLSFVVVVINQTAGVVQLAKEVNPSLGTATLWGLLIAYGGLVGVPVVIVMRMPRPLVPPASEASARNSTTISSGWASDWRSTPGSSVPRSGRSTAAVSTTHSACSTTMPTPSSSKWRRRSS